MAKATFGARFKGCRNKLGLTQDELADIFNKKYDYTFSKSSISMYENDKQVPEINVLEKWATFFDVSLDYLLGRSNIPSQDSYYLDPEAAKYAQEIYDNPDLRILFDASRKISKKDMEFVVDLIKRMRGEN